MFTLPPLPYEYHALEPFVDAETMKIHHDKHHGGYVEKLNKALEGQPSLASKSIEELLADTASIPESIRQSVINNGGGHANHSMFWTILTPKGGGGPTGPLKEAIDKEFESFENFKTQFSEKAMSVFGSGWAFLNLKDGKLSIKRHSFQNSPLMYSANPLMGLDVWEHAYYLKYQNKRREYVEAFWNIVNWEEVGKRFASES